MILARRGQATMESSLKSSVLFIDKRGKNFWYSLWILRNARSPDDWA